MIFFVCLINDHFLVRITPCPETKEKTKTKSKIFFRKVILPEMFAKYQTERRMALSVVMTKNAKYSGFILNACISVKYQKENGFVLNVKNEGI